MRLYEPLEKAKRIKKEVARLKRLFKDLPGDKKKAGEGLIQEAAFMRATLEEARYIIDQEGILEHFEQGSQKFLREHPATKVYNTMIQRYSAVSKQIFDMLPTEEATTEQDELMEFVKRVKVK
jgi:uncharacterized protein YfbU (UPF0304 family)